ncbi:MAG: hypothetical protein J7L39_04020, partial [Candidatus Aenigmarchaeota archaeon]|nr:hypothetical protein [Candidatus Aenigmarchaeota archaeon]
MMKKFVACFLFSLLIFTNTSIAQPNFEISADKSYVEVPTLGSQFVEITIVNNQNFDDLFTFSVFPSSIYGISLTFEKNAIKVPAKSSASLYLMFSASVTAEEIPIHFRISATSSETGYSKQITILAKAKRTVPVYISGLRVDKYLLEPSETVNVFVDLTNLEEKVSDKFFVDLNLTKDGEIIHSERKIVKDIEPKSTKTITFSYTFDKYAPNGTYYVRVSLKNVENREIDERGP